MKRIIKKIVIACALLIGIQPAAQAFSLETIKNFCTETVYSLKPYLSLETLVMGTAATAVVGFFAYSFYKASQQRSISTEVVVDPDILEIRNIVVRLELVDGQHLESIKDVALKNAISEYNKVVEEHNKYCKKPETTIYEKECSLEKVKAKANRIQHICNRIEGF